MDLLSQGIDILCKNDSDIKALISARREDIISLLVRYIKEIELFNPAYGLVGVNSAEELIIKHILDSLAPLGIISRLLKPLCAANESLKIADAGSGAGLPGIPLAITLPEYDFSLIERMGRRAGFLCNTKAVLALSNITITESEIEKAAHNSFNLVTFRAFKPLDKKLLKTLQNVCVKGGVIAAYKGRQEKIKEEMASFGDGLSWEAIPCPVPFLDEERNLLVIR
ncbi:MAG: 16S rRNA (guanine(527)-N(7))-methyltransferase RsmG [Treponema sp.]|nr:16S rRNA (guanine(527)-N(7))-methyltransferase RsmG [Treponema sp.]